MELLLSFIFPSLPKVHSWFSIKNISFSWWLSEVARGFQQAVRLKNLLIKQ
jgi:hypothetical protein